MQDPFDGYYFLVPKIAVVEQDLIRPTSFSREHSILLLLAERLPDDGHQLLVRGEVAAREPLPELLVTVDAGRDDGDCGCHFHSKFSSSR